MNNRRSHPKTNLITRSAVVLFGLSVATALGQGAFLPIISLNPATQYSFNEDHGDGMVGWVFNLKQTITVNQVGWYDDGQDGLSRDYQIGLWQDLAHTADWLLVYSTFQTTNPYSIIGDPVRGLTLPGGTNASLNGAYRVVNLDPPVTLVPGNYELGGLDTASTADPIHYVAGQHPSSVAGITQGPFFYADGFRPTNTLGVTQSLYLANGLELGPMLFTAAPGPVPPSFLGIGLVGKQFGFTVSGTSGARYVLQVATNLASPFWIGVATNTAPFSFVESNANTTPYRFYRATVAH